MRDFALATSVVAAVLIGIWGFWDGTKRWRR